MGRQSALSGLLLLVLAAIVIAGLTWTNYRFASANPGGNDFIPRWRATQLFLQKGQSPYSAETSLAIQERLYGRAAWPSEDQALFAYPYYTLFVFSPIALVEDYALARAIWMTLLELSLFATAIFALILADWKPSRTSLISFLLFSILWFHGAKPLFDGNPSVLVALFATLALLLLAQGNDTGAGILLALAMIKPQMVILFLPYTLIWAVSHRRMRMIKSFVISFSLLLALSFWLQPDWLIANFAQLMAYQTYAPPGTPATIFATWWPENGSIWGWGLSLLAFLILLFEWWRSMAKPFTWFLWTASLTLVFTPLIGIPSTTSNFAIMLPVLPLLFAAWQKRLNQQKDYLVWGFLLFLFAGIWILYTSTLQPGFQFREHLAMLFPLPLVLLVLLFWQRWWIVMPADLSYPAKRVPKKVTDDPKF